MVTQPFPNHHFITPSYPFPSYLFITPAPFITTHYLLSSPEQPFRTFNILVWRFFTRISTTISGQSFTNFKPGTVWSYCLNEQIVNWLKDIQRLFQDPFYKGPLRANIPMHSIWTWKAFLTTWWHHQRRFWRFFSLNGRRISSCIATQWWEEVAQKLAALSGRFALILIFLCIGACRDINLLLKWQYTFWTQNMPLPLMTCSICKCTDRQRNRFTMFNVYISGAAVSQGCNVVRPKHGNISSLVSGYVAKMKMHDKIGGELKTCIILAI